jgi:hypothetical protein
MYNIVFGENSIADDILSTLGLNKASVGRFRDAFVMNGEIVIYTRNGGGNREQFQPIIDELKKHPCYLRDEDDDFDSTYCSIYFKFPEEYKEGLELVNEKRVWDPSQRWLDAIEAIKNIKPPEKTE